MFLYQRKVDIDLQASKVIRQINLFFFGVMLITIWHHLFFVDADILDSIVYGLIYLPICILLLLVSKLNRSFYLPNVKVILFFFVIGCIGKLVSRYQYANALLDVGNVYLVRNMEELGGGGWYSYFAIFFYPSVILLFFCSLKYKFNYILYIAIFGFALFDMLGVAMRMTPVFVLIFAFFIMFSNTKLKSLIFLSCILLLSVVWAFKFTTQLKSAYQEDMDWGRHLQNTISTEVVKIDKDILRANYDDLFYSYVFLSHYAYHPIGELSHYLNSKSINYNEPNLLRLKSQFCVLLKCNFEQEIRTIDSRYGVYKTFHYSMISDFGFAYYIPMYLVIYFLLIIFFFIRRYSFIHLFLLVILVLSPIENFFYTGMGVVQEMIILFIMVVSFFVTKRHDNSS